MTEYEKIDVIEMAELKCKLSGKEFLEYSQEEKEKGCKILEKCIQEIKGEIPELIPAINIFKLFPVKLNIPISTDFERLFFNPKRLVRAKEGGIEYREVRYEKEIKLQILHILLHGLLGDGEVARSEKKNMVLWLATDQRVGDICQKLGYDLSKQREYYLSMMKSKSPYSSSYGNYILAKHNSHLKKGIRSAWNKISCDDHNYWYPEYIKKVFGIEAEIEGSDSNGENKQNESDMSGRWKKARELFFNSEGQVKKIRNRGVGAGNSYTQVEKAEGFPMDYKGLIQELLTMQEDPREIMDSIDPMMYQFGLDTYGDVPLIEPKEEDEIKKLNTICIAIDTSGSCSGEIAAIFLRELREIFREIKADTGCSKIMLLQCDYLIQKEEIYEMNDFVNELDDNMKLYGWGGTSFIPVFERINQYESDESEKIDALIYLSDGYGDFPEDEPDYPVVFVMCKEDAEAEFRKVPEWIKIGVIE